MPSASAAAGNHFHDKQQHEHSGPKSQLTEQNDQGLSPTESTTLPTPSKAQHAARKRALYQATVLETPWIPDRIKAVLFGKQVEFLCFEGREALYGGAVGDGKSVALLVAALQFIQETGYSALNLRRTYRQLGKSDSILAKAKEWLHSRPACVTDDHKITLPGGSSHGTHRFFLLPS